jgi:hypothetical protein
MKICRGAILSLVVVAGCRNGPTGKLSPETASRLNAEGVTRRADDLTFRYTFGAGRSNAGWEDRRASIVVTHSSVLIHKNDKVGFDIRPGHADRYSVERSGARVRIREGTGQRAEIWSFEPPEDAAGWTADIRAAIRSTVARQSTDTARRSP